MNLPNKDTANKYDVGQDVEIVSPDDGDESVLRIGTKCRIIEINPCDYTLEAENGDIGFYSDKELEAL